MASRSNYIKTYGVNAFKGYSDVSYRIRNAVINGNLAYTTQVLRGFQRLDNLAGEHYGDGRLWWIIAAASGIGWGLQVPPGVEINIPDIEQTLSLLG